MLKIVTLRDGQELDRCLECGRDWNTVRHSSKGFCRGCARKKQHKERKIPTKWSTKFQHCQNISCPNTKNGITSQPHNAKGLCRSCYSKEQRHRTRLHTLQVESVRRKARKSTLKTNEDN